MLYSYSLNLALSINFILEVYDQEQFYSKSFLRAMLPRKSQNVVMLPLF